MIHVKMLKIEKYQGKLSEFNFEITRNAKYWWPCKSREESYTVETTSFQQLINFNGKQ